MIKKGLHALHFLLLKLHRTSLRRPKTTIALLGALVFLSFLPLANLKMLVSIDDLIDSDFQTYQQLNELKEHFLTQDEIGIIVRRTDGKQLDKNELCLVRGWIQKQVDNRGDLYAIVSTLGLSRPIETPSRLYLPPLIDIHCTNLDPETSAISQGTKKIIESPWRGTLTAEDGKDIIVLIYPDARQQATILGTFNPLLIKELQEDFKSVVLEKSSKLTATWVGDGIFQYYLHKGYETMPALNLIMSFFLIVFLRLFLGTFISSGLFLSIITWITLPIYAGMALSGHPIDVLSSSLSLMIVVASLEDFLFISYFSQKYGWRKSFRKLLLPSFFTSFTTVIGFGSLLLADLDMIRRFGLWAATSAVLEWVFMFLALPALLQIFPKMRQWVCMKRTWSLNFLSWQPKYPHKIVTWLALAVFPFSLWATQKLYVSDSPMELFRSEHPIRKSTKELEQSRGWQGKVSLVFAKHSEKDFNQAIIEKVKKWPLIDQVEDPYMINDYLTSDLSSSMKSYFMGIIENSTLGERLGPSSEDSSRALLYLKDLDIASVNPMRKKIQKLCPNQECWLAGSLISYGELGERVLSTLYKSLSGSLVLVSLVLLFLCLAINKSHFFPLILSAMWGPAAIIIFFYAFNIPLYYILSMIASILVGLTGDNAIQFLFFSEKKQNLNKSVNEISQAPILVTIGMVLSASIFFFGYFEPMRTLGFFMMMGFILSLFGDVWVLKGLLNLSKKKP